MGRRRSALSAFAALSLALLAASPLAARGGSQKVDAELVLAVDISYSMDRVEQELQRDGYVQAITSPEFLNALKSNLHGRIAVTYLQWESYRDQDVLLPWMIIDGLDTLTAFDNLETIGEAPAKRVEVISATVDPE